MVKGKHMYLELDILNETLSIWRRIYILLTICLLLQSKVTISYNKLQADVKQGKSLDIVLKKVKHQMVEKMSSSTADALGLSRAILCNGKFHLLNMQ